MKNAVAQSDSLAIKKNLEHLKAIKDSFTLKPLKVLLDSSRVPIKAAFGNPENANMPDIEGPRSATFVFFFVGVEDVKSKRGAWVNNRRLLVTVMDAQGKYGRHPELPKNKEWNGQIAKRYEDMLVLRVGFLGDH
ncbi:hypothetical protein U0035_10790 [Niabella yanshanensis]|uniref:Uncharacterized protein n=1 Tax=Niabella yanshanensis TaxID=577386 RepID=A0ABZ0WD07_9BACT|nr:hypothetical protein [Niabella yanshanensis]WQD40635.1 hypothetical protein U0035_10790 [Niabella yanshanensis]